MIDIFFLSKHDTSVPVNVQMVHACSSMTHNRSSHYKTLHCFLWICIALCKHITSKYRLVVETQESEIIMFSDLKERNGNAEERYYN